MRAALGQTINNMMVTMNRWCLKHTRWFHFWPTVLSVVPLVHCLSVCRLSRFVLRWNGTS